MGKDVSSENDVLTCKNVFNMMARRENLKRCVSVLLLLCGLEETKDNASKQGKIMYG